MQSLVQICWLAVKPLPKALHRHPRASTSVRLTIAQGIVATFCILGAVVCSQALPLVARRAVDLLSHAGDVEQYDGVVTTGRVRTWLSPCLRVMAISFVV
jgi:hypothetical protein